LSEKAEGSAGKLEVGFCTTELFEEEWHPSRVRHRSVAGKHDKGRFGFLFRQNQGDLMSFFERIAQNVAQSIFVEIIKCRLRLKKLPDIWQILRVYFQTENRKFGSILEGLEIEDVSIFYTHLVYFKPN
jgi:hypothetical protein